jgi:hypothetical protein
VQPIAGIMSLVSNLKRIRLNRHRESSPA